MITLENIYILMYFAAGIVLSTIIEVPYGCP